jgi:transketolase
MKKKDFNSSRSWRWPPLYIPNELEEDMTIYENPLQSATKAWIEAVQEYFKDSPDRNKLTQIYMRGYFSGWSEREIAQLADKLAQNENDYPLWRDKE